MSTIVHFEVPSDNVARTKKFYNSLFGWKMEKVPGPTEYWTFRTINDNDEETISGGILKRQQPEQAITNFIGVDSVTEYMKKIEALGGRVKVPKTEVPGFGWYAVCMDTENDTFALWEVNRESPKR